MDVSQQAEVVKYPTESQRSPLIRGNFAQWCARLQRFSHVAVKNDLGRQIAERAEAPENEGITSGQDCSSLMLGGSTRQAQDFPAARLLLCLHTVKRTWSHNSLSSGGKCRGNHRKQALLQCCESHPSSLSTKPTQPTRGECFGATFSLFQK